MKRKKRPVFHCKTCEYLKRVSSLFDDLEILECTKNGLHETINLVDSGGACRRRTSPAWCPLKRGCEYGEQL